MPSLHFATYSSPIGYLRIEHRGGRLCALQILEREPEVGQRGEPDPFADQLYEQVCEYLRGERREFEVELDLSGTTPFQRRVLEQLQRIPYAETRTYKEVAEAIGSPRGSRAVGMASHRNPIQLIIPCHRVVGARGALTGYAAGIETKSFLLALEAGICE